MSATVIDGKAIAQLIQAEIKLRVDELTERNIVPGLKVILIGDNPASVSYVRAKEKAAAKVGIKSEVINLPAQVEALQVEKLIDSINEDSSVHGVLLQLPIPEHLNADALLERISPYKDVDGLHPENMGLLCDGRPRFVPCTPLGIKELLDRSGIELNGKHVVVLGRSRLVGRPLSILLSLKGIDATVTICHSRTKDLLAYTRAADILVAAMGSPKFVTAEMIKPASVVVDVGVNRIGDKLVGDVDFEHAIEIAAAITPVPGGVGALTVSMLLFNTALAAERYSDGTS